MPNLFSEIGSPCIPVAPPLSTKEVDQVANKAAQSWLIFIYQAKLADLFRNITVTWCENTVYHYISFNVENTSDDQHPYIFKIDLKASQFWNKKGLKNFEIEGKRAFVYWDFRLAKFSSGPSPSSGYYVAIVYDDAIVLLLGDLQNDAFKRTKKPLNLPEATLLCKKENVYGKKLFCTKALLGDGKEEHDIVIENSLFGPGDPEMWISIDGLSTIRILNLNWRFRGNETILLMNGTSVQFFWDVHDWLFNESNSSYGIFIFNPKKIECESNSDHGAGKENDDSIQGFCHILYALKME